MQGMKNCTTGHDIFNVCTGYQTTIKELAYIMINIVGNHCDIEYQPSRTGDIRISFGSPQKIQQILSYTAETRIGEGLEIVLSHMQQDMFFSIVEKRTEDFHAYS